MDFLPLMTILYADALRRAAARDVSGGIEEAQREVENNLHLRIPVTCELWLFQSSQKLN